MYLIHNSQSLFGECRSMPGVLIYWFLYMAFSVLSARCHTKGPTNLQVLIYGFLVYCLPGVTQKVLPIYRFLYMRFFVYCLQGVTEKVLPICRFLYTGFYFIVCKVSHKRSPQSTGSYIRDFSFKDISRRRFGVYLNHNSQSLFEECRSIPGVLIYWFLYMGF